MKRLSTIVLALGVLLILQVPFAQGRPASDANSWAYCTDTFGDPTTDRIHTGYGAAAWFHIEDLGGSAKVAGSGTNSQTKSDATDYLQAIANGKWVAHVEDLNGIASNGLGVPNGFGGFESEAEAYATSVLGFSATYSHSPKPTQPMACPSSPPAKAEMQVSGISCNPEISESMVGSGTIHYSPSDEAAYLVGSRATGEGLAFKWTGPVSMSNDPSSYSGFDGNLPTDSLPVYDVHFILTAQVCSATKISYPASWGVTVAYPSA